MLTKKEQKLVVEHYIQNWYDWRMSRDRDFKLACGARMTGAVAISKLLKIPASLFAEARKKAESEVGKDGSLKA
jgi:hypothetical protein